MISKLKVVSSLIAGLILISCSSTKNQEIFESFEGEEGVYMIKLPPGLFLNMVDRGSEAETDELGNVDFVKVMMFDQENSNSLTNSEIADDINSKLDKYGYEVAIEFSSGGTAISAHMLQKDEYISDLILLVIENESMIGLGLSGKLDGKSIMNFASDIDYEDLKGLTSGDFSF